MMEPTDVIELEPSNGGLEKALTTNGLGSGAAASEDNGAGALQTNGSLEGQLQAQAADVSETGVKGSTSISKNTASNLLKKAAAVQGNDLKNIKTQKVQKDGSNLIGAVVTSKNSKPRISQSLSFPAKTIPTNGLRKSTADLKQAKVDANFSSANSELINTGTTTRRENTVTAGSSQQFLPAHAGSLDDGASSEATHDLTTHTKAQRRSASGFSFRLEERAEKRKEYFTKLEEKFNAKELEKTNIQAKSKENQEAEIKQLRKSLTFKATPMPSFYQEPPSKVELKKIPPTRARSPKLGRHKPSNPAANNSSEGTDSFQTPPESDPISVKQNGGVATLKKPAVQKPISRLSSEKSSTVRPETKAAAPKIKPSNMKQKLEKGKEEERENGVEHETKPAEDSPADAIAEVSEEGS